eukprot:TRINITY_DN91_c0_g1_i1.p1 TRINITY_DN91_c0_g1~~TRINITY_DN91_c0_g1_i1.p1  ORF type:complete len:169 (+),score=66.48 TRINITY_DN91_c0_g1_i1:66-572(+)
MCIRDRYQRRVHGETTCLEQLNYKDLKKLYIMGRVRTKTIKRAAKQFVEKYFSKLTYDFQINKKILEDSATIPTKRLKNKIAGFATHLMKRISKAPVRGISLKLQEEERERRMDTIPERSAIDITNVTIDQNTKIMLQKLNLDTLPGLNVEQKTQNFQQQKKPFQKRN